MPDDAAVGLTTVAADELEFVNGLAQSEPLPKAQRVRPVHGPDGQAWDVSTDHPLPTTDAGLGADGDAPPTVATNASGVRGWLRGIYDRLGGTLTVHVDNESAAVDVSTLAKDATLSGAVGGPGSSPPALVNSGSGLLGYLRNILDAVRGTLTVGGTVNVGNLPATQPVSGTVAATIAALTDGTAQVKFVAPAGSTTTNVAASTTTGTLAAANAARRGLYVFNDSTANLFLKLGATASTSSFTVKIPAGGLYELPVPFYRGVVDGIWDAANGNARVTELS